MKRIAILLLSLHGFLQLQAQDSTAVAHGTGLRADGKIYVVVLVVVIILLGLFVYVARLDRKISRLEKKQQ